MAATQTNIYGDRARAADPFEFLFLQRAQNLRLEFQREVADFIQEECSLMGQLQPADLLRDRSRKSPFFVAEQFAFKKAGGNGRAVEFDEGVIPARAQPVDGARDQFLARSSFSENQNGGIRCRHVLHLFQYALQTGAFADDFVELVRGDEFFFQIAVFCVRFAAGLLRLLFFCERSRMTLRTDWPLAPLTGPSMISTGNSLPSLRRPYSSSPGTHGAHAGVSGVVRPMLGCVVRNRSGIRTSTGWPRSSERAYPKNFSTCALTSGFFLRGQLPRWRQARIQIISRTIHLHRFGGFFQMFLHSRSGSSRMRRAPGS